MAAQVLQPGIGGLLVSSSVCAMRAVGGQLWLVAVVAVGESSDVVELVGIDGGGGTSVTHCQLTISLANSRYIT